MRKTFTLLLGLLPLYAGADTLEIAGAEMTYSYSGNSGYEVKLNIYTRCNRYAMDPVYITVSSPDGNLIPQTILADLTDMGQIPVDCHTTHHHPTSCDDQAVTWAGIRKWTAIAHFNLQNFTGTCEFLFSWQSCCRTKLITSGSALESFYIDAYLNICEEKANSPQFTSDYRPILGRGSCATRNNTAVDAIGSSGYLYNYALTRPRKTSISDATISPPLTYEKPFTETAGTGCGFQLNQSTGQMQLQPEQGDEFFPISIMLYKTYNGKLVSRITRDLMYRVWDFFDENTAPVITGAYCIEKDTVFVRPGDSISFMICSYDLDQNDTVFLSAHPEMQGTSVIIEEGKKWPKAAFAWRTKKMDERVEPYKLLLRAETTSLCDEFLGRPSTGLTEKTIFIYVSESAGLEAIKPIQNISIYPSPGKEAVYSDIPEAKIRSLELMDMTGRSIMPGYSFTGGKLAIDVSRLNPGSYILRVYADRNVYSGKVIIVR